MLGNNSFGNGDVADLDLQVLTFSVLTDKVFHTRFLLQCAVWNCFQFILCESSVYQSGDVENI